MKTSRVAGIPRVADEQIVRYVKRFGPVSTSKIKRALGSKSKSFAKQVGECPQLRCVGVNDDREKVWEHRDA